MERLAERMRPSNLSEWIGQAHILAEGKPLRMAIEQDRVPSMIFYGPPGCGKTSLAFLIGKLTKANVIKLHASDATVKDVRSAIEQAQSFGRMHNQQTILFLDEIHRFTATQQDALLSAVEKGTIVLIGATTEHPGFSIQKALLSRVTLFVFHPLLETEIEAALQVALEDHSRGLGSHELTSEANVLSRLAQKASGDLRLGYQLLEWTVEAQRSRTLKNPAKESNLLTLRDVEEAIRVPAKGADTSTQYDVLSAFHKSVRGSSDAAMFWFLYGVEELGMDPRIFLRRLVVACSEDIGMAQPIAMQQALDAFHAYEKIGWPESRYNACQAILYAVECPKSNSIGKAIAEAKKRIERATAPIEVPHHLRNQPLESFSKNIVGSDRPRESSYKYPHDYPGHYVNQSYFPIGWKEKPLFEPTEQGLELKMKQNRQLRKPSQSD